MVAVQGSVGGGGPGHHIRVQTSGRCARVLTCRNGEESACGDGHGGVPGMGRAGRKPLATG
jgi:hypothetical protein